MLKYAKVINETTKECQVGIGTNVNFYRSIEFEELNVEQGADGNWYLAEHVPQTDISNLQVTKLAQIQTWTEQAIIAGFSSDCVGVSVRFDSDLTTQITMQGIALNINSEQFATEYPGGFPVRGYANDSDTKTVFMLAPTQVLQFCADQSKHIRMQKQHGWELQQAVTAAVSAEDLAAITWQTQ